MRVGWTKWIFQKELFLEISQDSEKIVGSKRGEPVQNQVRSCELTSLG